MTLFLVACASSAPPPPPPKPATKLPSAALDVICSRLHAEGMTSEVRVVKETQPIVTPGSLQALAEAYGNTRPVRVDAIQSVLTAPLVPVEIPPRTCFTRSITSAEIGKSMDVMVVQFSSPFVNPFGRGEWGTMVRLSLGGEESNWYWIPLLNRNDQWLAGLPLTLSVTE